jgi:hypothetical protein
MDEQDNRYSKEQKIGVVLLSVFVLLAVTLGLIQARNTLYKPFALNTSIPPLIGREVNTSEALRYRDTDNDGLSDYDELYVYNTSPYLADTDSDGISDYDEIKQGKNPLCPEGQNCGNIADSSSGIPTTPDYGELFVMEDGMIPESLEDLFKPEDMRLLLIESGLDKSVVDMISDEEINKIMIDILTSDDLSSESSAGATSTAETRQAIDYINKLMAEQKNN